MENSVHIALTHESAIEAIELMEAKLQVAGVNEKLYLPVLDDPKFLECSGSSNPNVHHYGRYGLAIHTFEVMMACETALFAFNGYEINKGALFLAALWHDYGKVFDYHWDGEAWKTTGHKKLINHIVRSAIEWEKACSGIVSGTQKEWITHAILSHAQLPEWGSPVRPKTRMAWILHCCDQMSARLYDVNTVGDLRK